MRFLMNSPAALTSTAVDSRVPTKLSLDALELSCFRILTGSLAPHPPGLLAWAKDSVQILRAPSILLLKATPAAIAPFESSPCCRLHPSSKVLFPYLEPRHS
jgi:hypothetical protein